MTLIGRGDTEAVESDAARPAQRAASSRADSSRKMVVSASRRSADGLTRIAGFGRRLPTFLRSLKDAARTAVRRGGLRRILIGISLAVIALATVTAFSAYYRTRQAPYWWRNVDPASPETAALAESVERGVVNTIHRGRESSEPWTVSITPEQADAWLNAKMPKWLTNRRIPWPEGVEQLQTDFREGRITLGAKIRANEASQVVAATVTPSLRADGSLWMAISEARAGRLDLPTDWTVRQLRDWLPPHMRERESTKAVLDALMGSAPLFADSIIKLEDGRRVRLVAIKPEVGRLLLTCVTESNGAK